MFVMWQRAVCKQCPAWDVPPYYSLPNATKLSFFFFKKIIFNCSNMFRSACFVNEIFEYFQLHPADVTKSNPIWSGTILRNSVSFVHVCVDSLPVLDVHTPPPLPPSIFMHTSLRKPTNPDCIRSQTAKYWYIDDLKQRIFVSKLRSKFTVIFHLWIFYIIKIALIANASLSFHGHSSCSGLIFYLFFYLFIFKLHAHIRQITNMTNMFC